MNIYPAIDLKGGCVVRLTQGDFNQETIYSDDPVKVALEYKQKGAWWLHIIDLDGAKTGIPVNLEIIKKIKDQTGLMLQVGGGIRSLATAKSLIMAGVDRLIIGTVAFDNPKVFEELLKNFGDKIIVSIDTANEIVRTHGWLKESDLNITSAILNLEKHGVQRFIYTDILKDGSLTGPNYTFIEKLLSKMSSPLAIAGGIANIDQVKNLKSIGVDGVILGKALYEGTIKLEEALNVS